ncbi:nif-specific transcriptional activator NifA [Desulfobulbus alkaliphilus]|uniref:nif-specific transcriptional activator NifA n=1 Tax=Desulfobulbus alkaliphilus TaxID=869814 RepID=UPI001963D1EA|nr:nif-specific transcriptional activator NifA [Desulfobulbus alkaliphilus]MBM9538061.1 nif-specific transcriptional activator NifA [Desulfobulbus alkaliphilus]
MNNLEKDKEYTDSDGAATAALEVQALYRIVKLIGSAVHLDSALASILKVLHDTLRMERATLALLDESGQHLAIRASYGLTVAEEQRGVYGLKEGIYGQVFSTGSPFIVPDVHSEPLFLNRTGARGKISKKTIAFIGVPVILSGVTVGVLSVDRLFGADISFEEDVRFLTVLATLIAQFLSLNRAIRKDREQLVLENLSLKEKLQGRHHRHQIIGQSKAMQEVYWSIDRVAPSSATVLLLGESGTGKELVARAVHDASPRTKNAFIKVNCAALPENLLESELFGHEKGSFTGAVVSRIGRFEQADKGTIFLDEIGELPLPLQSKLLRVLQEQQFERLGDSRTRSVDVRIIAATNVSLDRAVAQGVFRNDLYYRLNVVPIHLPPLRNRRDDIPLLLDHFLRASNARNEKALRMTREFLDLLTDYDWPGNVRELQNLVERLVILAGSDVLRVEDLPEYMLKPESKPMPASVDPVLPSASVATPPGTRKSLKDLEREQVESALIRNGWVQSRAARELGLTQRQMGYRMKKFDLHRPEY